MFGWFSIIRDKIKYEITYFLSYLMCDMIGYWNII